MGQMFNKQSQSNSFSNQNNIQYQQQNQYQEQVQVIGDQGHQKYDDDEVLILEKQQIKQGVDSGSLYDLEKDLKLSLESLTKAIKISKSKEQFLPVQVKVSLEKSLGKDQKKSAMEQRGGVDLICVIDKSGSMSGEKIELVKKTLIQLGEFLGEQDRIALIEFESSARRILPLTCFSAKNKGKIENAVKGLYASGGTKIGSGMSLAYKIMNERVHKNSITSIFLLSDGQDGSGVSDVQRLKMEYKQQESYSINCFGFGADHDPQLMNSISKLGDGNFYYVEKLDQVDELFVDALGGLFSVGAQNLRIEVKINSKGESNKIFSDVTIQKLYGDMWKKNTKDNSNYVEIRQMISGVSKEYVFEVLVPPIDAQLQDFQRNASFIECKLTAESLGENKTYEKKAELSLAIYNENENIPEEINEDVQINLLRVQGAEAIEQARINANQGKYKNSQDIMEQMEQKFLKLKPEVRKKVAMLEADVIESKKLSSNEQIYQQQGNIKLMTNNKAHMEKKSRGNKFSSDMYQNESQQQMVYQVQSKKI